MSLTSMAAGDVPEREMDVGKNGFTVKDESGWGYDALTSFAESTDFVQGTHLYTSDSETKNDLSGTHPGGTVSADLGFVPTVDGNRLTESDVVVQAFVNIDKQTYAEQCYEAMGYDTSMSFSDYLAMVQECPDLISSTRGYYLTQEYPTKIVYNEDGTATLLVPEGVPDNAIIAITKVRDKDGNWITINSIQRYFITLGDGSYSNDPSVLDALKNGDNGSEDDGHRYYSIQKTDIPYEYMTPAISSRIFSNQYQVETSIPTSENLTWSITADNAIYDIGTRKAQMQAGVKNITIKLTASYTQKHSRVYKNKKGKLVTERWETTEHVERTVTTDFSYASPTVTVYDVPRSNIYPVQSGVLQAKNGSFVLSSGGIGLAGSATKGPQLLGFIGKKPSVSDVETQDLGHYANYSDAMSALNGNDGGAVKGRIMAAVNASVGYTGSVNYAYYGLNVTTTSHNGVKPVVAKASGSATNMIPSTHANGLYVGSGSVSYAGGHSFGTKPNDVIVHTPVVNNAYISWISQFINQKINKDPNRTYLMLDEEFTITIPNNGTHNNFQGYGTRTYNTNQGVPGAATTWGKIKDVKLPFDAYLHYKKNGVTYRYFIKANTWLSESGASSVISLTGNTYTYTIPVWVTEKTYDIETRVIAENATNYALTEDFLNSNIMNYVATRKIPVEIIGKIYDLRISSSNDPEWQNKVYSWKNQRDYITADEFPFGQAGQNKTTQYKYAPKLGYTFVFDFKTKGRKSNNIDVSIQPEGFYFVSRDGKTTQEVDLYYNTTKKQNIKIELGDSNTNLSVRLNDAFLRVAAQEFTDTNRIYQTEYGKVYNYSLGVTVGTFAKMNMPHQLRLCYNNFAEYVNALYGLGSTENSISQDAGTRDNVIGSVGHWYAGYRLPASTKAVSKGMNINDAIKNKSFLTDGYIVVKFDLKTKFQNTIGNYDYLQYMGPEAMNEGGDGLGYPNPDWTKEQDQTIVLPNGNTAKVPVGSVAIYEAGLRSSNDSEVAGTH